MRKMRARSILLLHTTLFLLIPVVARAQETEEVAKGICAPWHRCLAIAGLGMTGVMLLVLFLGYLIQRRGFDTIEHRQGNPEGIPVEKR